LNESPLFRRSSSEEKLAMFIKQFLNARIATNVPQLGDACHGSEAVKNTPTESAPGE
jgi:hypothetical protein